MWFARKQFYKYLDQNKICVENAYWLSLTQEERTEVIREYYLNK